MTDPQTASPKRAEPGWPSVVIGGAYYTGIRLMRDLLRFGVKVSCFDISPEQPGFHSVYGKATVCPNPDEQPEAWVQFMIEQARKHDTRPVFIATADTFVTALARHAEVLKEHFLFHDSAIQLQAELATKQSQYALAAEYGMPIPRTLYAESAQQIEEFANSARFPCLLKPLHGREWEALPAGHPFAFKKLVTANTPDEMVAVYAEASRINPKVVVQEIIEGPDTAKVVYLSCYGRNGDRLASCIVREMRCWPMYYGSASVVEPLDDPETDAICDQFLRRIGYVGLCEIELKRDTRDSKIKMIEANPRYTGTSDAAPPAGVHLGWIHYLDLIGKPVEPVGWNKRDFRHITLVRDIPCLGSYRRAGLETWRSIMRSYRPPLAFYDFDLRDWKVTARTVGKLTREVLGQVYRSFFPKRKKQ